MRSYIIIHPQTALANDVIFKPLPNFGDVTFFAKPSKKRQESRAVARKPRDATAVLFGSKYVDNIHCKFKSSQASKARLHSSKRTDAKQNLTPF